MPHITQTPSQSWQLTAVWWYLLYFGAQVTLQPFLTAWFASQGLSEQQLGLINAFRPWISLPASFLWGVLADTFHAHRPIMLGCFVCATGLRCLFFIVHRFGSIMALALAVQVLSTPVGVLADAAVVAMCKEGEYGLYRKWGAVGWGVMSTVSGAGIDMWGMQAALLLHLLLSLPCLYLGWRLHVPHAAAKQPAVPSARCESGAQDESHALLAPLPSDAGSHQNTTVNPARRASYHELAELRTPSQHSLLGSTAAAGVVRGGTAAGVAILTAYNRRGSSCEPQVAGEDREAGDADACVPHHPEVLTASPGGGGAAEVGMQQGESARLPTSTHATGDAGNYRSQPPSSSTSCDGSGGQGGGQQPGLPQLLTDKHVIVFLATATLMGCGFGLIDTFLFPFLATLGASQLLMGLTLTITCAAEVPVFEVQSRLTQHVSVERLLDVVVIVYALRMLAYACLPGWRSVSAVLPVEVLHGITFGLGWGVGTTNCKRLAPPGLAATMQGIFQGCYFGFGYGLGALFGGVVSERHGFPYMYLAGAGAMLLGWCGIVCARACVSRQLPALTSWLGSSKRQKLSRSERAQYVPLEVQSC